MLTIVQCAQHGAEPVEACRNCATAALVNAAADRDHLEERIRVLERRLAAVLRFQSGGERDRQRRTWAARGRVWSGQESRR